MSAYRIEPEEQAILALERVCRNPHESAQLIAKYRGYCFLGMAEQADAVKRQMWQRAVELGRTA